MTDDATPYARDADITAQTTATTDATGAAAAPTQRRRSGGALAGLALLASLLALSAAAYLYYALIYLQPNQVAAAEHAVVAQRLASLLMRTMNISLMLMQDRSEHTTSMECCLLLSLLSAIRSID